MAAYVYESEMDRTADEVLSAEDFDLARQEARSPERLPCDQAKGR
jgi:hypothetical protein